MKIEPKTLKGFRDFLPKEAKKRQYVLETLKRVFESYGFEPLETPALEYEEILNGKYGDEGDKLMYRFTDNGDRKVALRYDQTVPLARVVMQYQNDLPMPFMRYQIQNVWRAENTQRGRYREFLQCDADIVGTKSIRADVQVITVAAAGLYELGFRNFKVLINDRDIFSEVGEKVRKKFPNILEKQLNLFFTIALGMDKFEKIGKEGVLKEFTDAGLSIEEAKYCFELVTQKIPTERLSKILTALETIKSWFPENIKFEFSPTLARGLNYYTGMIFEIEIDGYTAGSVAGGGRYDNLIGIFSKYNQQIPAVGFSYGFDRLMEAIETLKINLSLPPIMDVLVAFTDNQFGNKALEIANSIRANNMKVEIFLGDEGTDLEKQLKYADKKQIPFVIIINDKGLMLKDMANRTQEELTIEQILKKLK